MTNDPIQRQDAIDAICGQCSMAKAGERCTDDFCPDVIALKEVPSAQKKGEWIPVTNGRGGHECSLCHNYAPSYPTGDEWLTDFCPNCGNPML